LIVSAPAVNVAGQWHPRYRFKLPAVFFLTEDIQKYKIVWWFASVEYLQKKAGMACLSNPFGEEKPGYSFVV
jgi:hypothetical protein